MRKSQHDQRHLSKLLNNDWINIKKCKPINGQKVFGKIGKNTQVVVVFLGGHFMFSDGVREAKGITHWKKLTS